MLDKKTLIMITSFVFFILSGFIVWFLIVPEDDEELPKRTGEPSPAPQASSSVTTPTTRNAARAGRSLVKIRL